MEWTAQWIWTQEKLAPVNNFVRFRRVFEAQKRALCHITARSRYALYINGEYLGQGPVRSWPNHLRYDTYDLSPYLREGKNCIAVLVYDPVFGNFQYLPQPPGLLAQIETEQGVIGTDSTWKVSVEPAMVPVTPRISCQQAFEEQYDARKEEPWKCVNYEDSHWPQAHGVGPVTSDITLKPRDIPFLTLDPVLPQRIVKVEAVTSAPYIWNIFPKPYVAPGDYSTNNLLCHAYIFTQIWSPEETEAEFIRPKGDFQDFKLNGQLMSDVRVKLRQGWNQLLIPYEGMRHGVELCLVVRTESRLRFACRGDAGGSPWAVIGPFPLTQRQQQRAANHMDESLILCRPLVAAATAEAAVRVWEQQDLEWALEQPFFREVAAEDLPEVNVFAQSYTDKVHDEEVRIEAVEALLSDNHQWTTVYPVPGKDVRILLDYGDEVVGFQRLEVEAPEGTILDFHNFEFIQPDGRYNFAEGMNNSFRYICRGGRQSYQTFVRRGFRYSYVTIRDFHQPVRFRKLEVLHNTYPQRNTGSFQCSDALLNRIWQVGARTLELCSEDTYVDCPTYEQVLWVGDARNEALIDWVINGDPRLWYRCLELAGQSLERSKIVESHVPSAWQNILPAWSLLWMRSCWEYYLFTKDRAGSEKLLQFVKENVAGLRSYLNRQHLLDIRAWNLFDWAPMDTPTRGVVTHQNCLAVVALREAATFAASLGEPDTARDFEVFAQGLDEAINRYLWNETKGAYTDCLRPDGSMSPVYSQQTQTVAYLSGVAKGERAESCRRIIYDPPEDFVRSGSPFFQFFLLEALKQDQRDQEFIDIIRRDWGFMIEMGATTFWEMWHRDKPRMTRSHCHAWSAAPTYFLSTHVLGVRPIQPGFDKVVIEPHPGDLKWCRGTMPTLLGPITVYWYRDQEVLRVEVSAPEEVQVEFNCPQGTVRILNGLIID
ncbi:MAG TPA: family 78 glycoside hydrolase catalytic domain [Firmicutes bacterium]|nr:family 78 glycoside hydrolase catalytic domain [Bacillota bacterium]